MVFHEYILNFLCSLCMYSSRYVFARTLAAASVLAKTYRDEYMQKLHKKFKMYSWKTNMGYGTPEHRSAIEKHGLCQYHRKSFNIFAARLVEVHDDEVAEQLPLTPPIPQGLVELPATHLSYNLSL